MSERLERWKEEDANRMLREGEEDAKLNRRQRRIIQYAEAARAFMEKGEYDNARAALRFAFRKAPVTLRSPE